MLVQYDFTVVQLRYLKRALDLIPSFRPLGQTPATVTTLITSSVAPRSAYIAAKTVLGGGRADRRVAVQVLHDACVDFHAQARNTFRKNPNVTERLTRLPTNDESFQETLTRAEAIAALWPLLPQVGTPPAAFTVAQGATTLALAGFNALRTAAGDAHEDVPEVDQDFQKAEADLHTKQREMEEVVQSSLAQGVSQFDEGTGEREIIDAIPTESPRNLPGMAIIDSAESVTASTVDLTFHAEGATSFDIYMKTETETEFSQIADDVIGGHYQAQGLSADPPGEHHSFYVRGRNARGFGPESTSVNVAVT